jgi:hypothetical protein
MYVDYMMGMVGSLVITISLLRLVELKYGDHYSLFAL